MPDERSGPGEITNVDQLRHEIDTGRTGDKVQASDPAAAPLGTDAEAGGTPVTKAELAMDVRASRPKRRSAEQMRVDNGWMYFPVSGAVALAIVALVFVAQQAA